MTSMGGSGEGESHAWSPEGCGVDGSLPDGESGPATAEARVERLLEELVEEVSSSNAKASSASEVSCVRELLATGVDHAGVRQLAIRAASEGLWSLAVAAWSVCLEEPAHRRRWRTHTQFAVALRETGRVEEAREALLTARQEFGPKVEILRELARTHASESDWDGLVHVWRAAKPGLPQNPSGGHLGSWVSPDEPLRIGLVIQGPMLSSGKTRHMALEAVTADDVVTLECTDNVTRLIREASSVVEEAVCVTWDTEDTRELRRQVGEEQVVQIRDTTRPLDPKSPLIPGNNKYRQFLSTLAGVEVVAARDCTAVIKVRTDQWVDVAVLSGYLRALHRAGLLEGRLVVPRFRTKRPAAIQDDFYFGGLAVTMRAACERYLHGPEFYEDVHQDLFYKWAWTLSGEQSGAPRRAYFPKGEPSLPSQLKLARRMWHRLFTPFPRAAAVSLVWRGQGGRRMGKGELFAEDGWPAIDRVFKDRYAVGSPNEMALLQRLGAVSWRRVLAHGYRSATGREGRGKASFSVEFAHPTQSTT